MMFPENLDLKKKIIIVSKEEGGEAAPGRGPWRGSCAWSLKHAQGQQLAGCVQTPLPSSGRNVRSTQEGHCLHVGGPRS